MNSDVINLGNSLVNCWAYRADDGYVIVDTGYKGNFRTFCRRLRKNHIAAEEIKYCFLTHSHDDHVGFLARIMAMNKDLRVIIHKEALSVLRAGENNFGGCTNKTVLLAYRLMRLFGGGKHLFPAITPNLEERIIVVDESNIPELEGALGGRIIETVGHTKDSISLLLDNGCMFCGDVAMNGFPSRHNVSVWAEDAVQYPEAWQKIISINPALLLPGHGKPFGTQKLKKNLRYAEKMKIYYLN